MNREERRHKDLMDSVFGKDPVEIVTYKIPKHWRAGKAKGMCPSCLWPQTYDDICYCCLDEIKKGNPVNPCDETPEQKKAFDRYFNRIDKSMTKI